MVKLFCRLAKFAIITDGMFIAIYLILRVLDHALIGYWNDGMLRMGELFAV